MTKDFKNLAFLLKPLWEVNKLYVLLVLVKSIFVAPILLVASVLFMQTVINAIERGATFQEVVVIIIVFVGIMCASNLLNVAMEAYCKVARTKIYIEISKTIYTKAHGTDYVHYDNPEFYDNYTWTIREYTAKINEATESVKGLLTSVGTMAGMVTIILTAGPFVLLIGAAVMLATSFLRKRINKIELAESEEKNPLERKLNYAERVFYNKEYAADMKSTMLKNYVTDICDNAATGIVKTVSRHAKRGIAAYGFANVINNIGQAASMVYIAYEILVSGRISGAGYFAGLVSANGVLFMNLGALTQQFAQVNRMSLYTVKIREFFGVSSPIEENSGTVVADANPFSLQFKNVNFAYPNSQFALKNINMEIKKGQRIAIVGENGAGKTTFTKLLLRLYDVSSGEILINGENISRYELSSLRNNIGVLFQQTNTYAFSLAENLQLYNKLDHGQVQEIIDTAMNVRDIQPSQSLTREFDQDGLVFSGGQNQRLGLARLLAKDFGLLIMDEPSSALDPISEKQILDIIFKRSMHSTSIMIAHRLSTVRDFDLIHVFENGSIIESGDHDALMTLKGKYFEMFTNQSENYVK